MDIKTISKSDLFVTTRTWAGEEITYNKKSKKAYLLLDQDWNGCGYYRPQRVQYKKAVVEGYRCNSKAQGEEYLFPVYKINPEDPEDMEFLGYCEDWQDCETVHTIKEA